MSEPHNHVSAGTGVDETCHDCGKTEPCDEKCPNHIEREPVAYVPRSKAPGSEGEPLWREVFAAKWLSKGAWDGFDLMPLYTDVPQASAGSEPVAWTNEAQLGFLKDPNYALIPMAMWAKHAEGYSDVPLYRAVPQTARETIIEECANIADDHTPAKHEGTLAAHVTGSAIAKAIRALSLSRPQLGGPEAHELVNSIMGAFYARYPEVQKAVNYDSASFGELTEKTKAMLRQALDRDAGNHEREQQK